MTTLPWDASLHASQGRAKLSPYGIAAPPGYKEPHPFVRPIEAIPIQQTNCTALVEPDP